MADYRFNILDSRTTLTNFSFPVPRSSPPQNPHIQLPALSFDNPRTARRRKRKSLQLSLVSKGYQEPTSAIPSSSNLDIVSTHEHSDGSIIFRFGDPSEVGKDDVLKDSNASVEEVCGEGKEEYGVVKVLDGEYERVIVKRIEREEGSQVLNNTFDVANSVVAVDSGSSKVVEEVSESREKLLKGRNQVEFPVSASTTELEKIEREEGSQGLNEALDVPDSSIIGSAESSEELSEEPECAQLSVSTSSTEMGKLEREEGSQGSNVAVAAATSLMATTDSEGSNFTDGVGESTEELLEHPEEDQFSVSVTRAKIKDEEILSTVSLDEKSNELEYDGTCGEVLDKKYDNEEALSAKSDFDPESGENNIDQEHKLEDFEVLDSSILDKEQGMESILQNVPQDRSESYAIEFMPFREAEPILDQDAENDTIQRFGGEDTNVMLPTININLPDQSLEAESSSNHLQTSDIQEVSGPEVIELRYTDSEAETSADKFPISDLPEDELIMLKATGISLASKKIPTPEFVLSSAAALLPHPSKVERMHTLLLPRIG